jgi:hypothetical protein
VVALDPEGRMYVASGGSRLRCVGREALRSHPAMEAAGGGKRADRSRAAWGRSLNVACASAMPPSGAGSSPPRATRRSGHKRSAAAWQ